MWQNVNGQNTQLHHSTETKSYKSQNAHLTSKIIIITKITFFFLFLPVQEAIGVHYQQLHMISSTGLLIKLPSFLYRHEQFSVLQTKLPKLWIRSITEVILQNETKIILKNTKNWLIIIQHWNMYTFYKLLDF